MTSQHFSDVRRELHELERRFEHFNQPLYLVGGAVRDMLLGRVDGPDRDLDLTTPARPDTIKLIVQNWADDVWTQGERFGTVGLRHDGRAIEITTHRADSYEPGSRKPIVAFGDSLHDDLARRDFTINAMAFRLGLDGDIIDPFGGRRDLADRILRTPLAADISFTDDPLRMLRAARFIAGFGCSPTSDLSQSARRLASRLDIVSNERIRDEFVKLIALEEPIAGLVFLIESGLAERFLPELAEIAADRLTVVATAARFAEPGVDVVRARLAALFDDSGAARRRLRALKFSGDDVNAVSTIAAQASCVCDHVGEWTDPQVRRHLLSTGSLQPEVHAVALARAGIAAADALDARITTLSKTEDVTALRSELSGDQVMAALGIRPGPHVGQAVRFLDELRLNEGQLGLSLATQRLSDWWLISRKDLE